MFGFIYIQFLNSGFDFGKFFVWLTELFSPNKKKYTKFKNVYTNKKKSETHTKNTSNSKDEVQIKIDVILDKISKSGYESLSKEEKEFLFKQR